MVTRAGLRRDVGRVVRSGRRQYVRARGFVGDVRRTGDVGEALRRHTRRRLDDAREQVRAATAQRDEARRALVTAREQRDEARAQVEALAFPDLAWRRQVERLRSHLPWDGTAAAPDGEAQRLAFGPLGSQNPYLNLLYGRCVEHGFDPFPLRRIEHPLPLRSGSVLHLHWTRFAQLGATEHDATARARRLVTELRKLRRGGVTLAWTVHEPLPHDCEFPAVEIGLREALAELSSVVHVMHPSTVDETRPHYDLPTDRLLVVDHPLYTGVYPDHVTRHAARLELGVDDEELLLLVFGGIRPYKGVDRLLRSIEVLHREGTKRRVRLLVAGPAYRSVDVSGLVLQAKSVPGVSIETTAVPTQYVQYLFRAADRVVLPYRDFLNSGVLMLALTFGCPVIAPENAVTRDAAASGLVTVFPGDDDGALHDLVGAAANADPEPPPAIDAEYARTHAPDHIAEQFARGLRERVDASRRTGTLAP